MAAGGKRGGAGGAVSTLAAFLREARKHPVSPSQREQLVLEAILTLQQFYVHLPFKRAMHGIDPVRRLRLILERSDLIDRDSDLAFHREMVSIFNSLRDRHTNYRLPEPFASRVAFLLFQIEECQGHSAPRYIISNLVTDARQISGRAPKAPWLNDLRKISRIARRFFEDHPELIDQDAEDGHTPKSAGLEVTHWNGAPIDVAVDALAARCAGANADAQHTQAVDRLTIRPMVASLPPDEHSVRVRYLHKGRTKELALPWLVFAPPPRPAAQPEEQGPDGRPIGRDVEAELALRARLALYAPVKLSKELLTLKTRSVRESKHPSVFDVDVVTSPKHRRYGLIGIRTFGKPTSVEEFAELVLDMPKDGLIIDVRNNGGGDIRTCEGMLQVLSRQPIEPETFQFIVSSQTRKLPSLKPDEYRRWEGSMARAGQTSATFSAAFSVSNAETFDNCNDIGQLYDGPILLIVNALCYSATDIFAAGYQDHEIGKILGVDGHTGGGGATVVEPPFLRDLFRPDPDSPFKKLDVPLPAGAGFNVALMRALRVKGQAGVELEDFGVTPNDLYALTRTDLLNGDKMLKKHAAALLDALTEPTSRLDLDARFDDASGRVVIDFRVENVDRVEIRIDDEAVGSIGGIDLETTCFIRRSKRPTDMRLVAFLDHRLVANRYLILLARKTRFAPNLLIFKDGDQTLIHE